MRFYWREFAEYLAERYVDRRLRLQSRLRGDCPDEWEYQGAMHFDPQAPSGSTADSSRSHP